DPDLVARVEDSIFNARPAGVRVIHNLSTGTQSDSARQAEAITRSQALADLKAQGEPPDINHLPADVLNSMPEGLLRIRAEVFLRLAEKNVAAAQKESLEDGARAAVADYIESLPMGAPIFYSKLLGRIVVPDAIADATLLIGAESGGQFHSYS